MAGLVNYRINPARGYSRNYKSRFIPTSTLYLTKNGGWIGLMKQSTSIWWQLQLNQLGAQKWVIRRFVSFGEVLMLCDVDSTVCLDEGIDELAEFCGAGKAVAEWTARAMGGFVPFEDALAARLSLLNPSLSQVQNFLEQRPPRLSPGIEDLVGKLRAKHIDVYLISGGFRQMINPVASILGIPKENIFANQLLFESSGEFLGFDKSEPTSKSGGKETAVQQIRKAHKYKILAMVGDGAADLEARRSGAADMLEHGSSAFLFPCFSF